VDEMLGSMTSAEERYQARDTASANLLAMLDTVKERNRLVNREPQQIVRGDDNRVRVLEAREDIR
jgi:hypothetical protein